ncbi:MAG TPA: hypothetical protein VJ304_01725, partial [Flavobacterium sp.]|nr:hypothetical protein [Flavobacterium sp.]
MTIDEKDRPYWKKVTIEVDKSHWKALFSTIAIPLLQHLKNENAITAYYLEIGKDVLHFAYKTSDGKKSDVVKMLRAFLLSENNAISTVKINSPKAGGFVYPLHNYGDLVSDFYPFEEFSDIIMA